MKAKYIVGILLFILISWSLTGIILYQDPNRGTFGDMFGSINSLYSGLAFAAIIYTVYLQKEELALQRNELVLTREEVSKQRELLKLQNEQISLQNFEGTFFQMMRMHNELLNSIDITVGRGEKASDIKTGRDCFTYVWFKYRANFHIDDFENISREERFQSITLAYKRLWNEYENEFSHYFRSLYNMFKYIDNSSVSNKKLYTNIIRAQLSSQELLLLFYNSLYNKSDKFMKLIEDYSLLKHIIPGYIYSDIDFTFFNKSVFGGEYPKK